MGVSASLELETRPPRQQLLNLAAVGRAQDVFSEIIKHAAVIYLQECGLSERERVKDEEE